jgi:LSD1 subclass zinc finger protein
MATGQAQGVACTSCGGPLMPQGNAVRVRCTFCGATNDIASAGAVQVARTLDRFGIRVPENPMTIAQIEEELARGEAKKREARRMGIIVAMVAFLVAAVIVVVALAAS